MDDSLILIFSEMYLSYIVCVNGMIIWFLNKEFCIIVWFVRNYIMCLEYCVWDIVFKCWEKK